MRRLRGQDAAFLYGETPTWHMHVCSVGIVDPTGSDYSFERLRQLLLERLPQVPQFRWKAVEVPFGLDRPGWVEDPDFDADYHIRRIGVPAPGTREQLDDLVGHLVSYKLNRDRPLWEMWVVEGLEGGRVALLAKVHHAIIDGVSGAGLGEVLFDIEPTPRPPDVTVRDSLHDSRVPSQTEMLVRGALNATVFTALRTARFAAQTVRQAATASTFLTRSERRPPMPFQAPRTRFNGELTPHRAYASARVSLERMKSLKRAFDVKLNDVVLALCAGALRDYLAAHGELPDGPLLAQVPVSLRTDADRHEVGNKVGTMFVSLASDIDDAAERLRTIYASSQDAKEMRLALSAGDIQGITETAPPALIALGARVISLAGLGGRTAPPVNVIISNVPGPPIPLYVAGARLESLVPLGPLLIGIGLTITVFSYVDNVDFGFMTCPELAPDIERLAERVPVALEELEKAEAAERGRQPRS
ncbi:MAG: WS/DGAT/MGAT family O-acyltransferase [Acidimicrobiales bacterium]